MPMLVRWHGVICVRHEPTSQRKAKALGMTISRGARAVATAALLVAAGTACAGGSSDASSDPTPTSTSRSPTATGTTTPPSDSEVAAEAATELVRTYYAVRDNLRQNPDTTLSRLKSVAISTELAAQQNLLKREREDGLHQTGDTKIAVLTAQAVDLDNSDPQAGRVPTVQIDVCFDVSAVDILDARGKSVVTDDRPETGWIRYSVSNYEWASTPTSAWRVASSENLERTPCAVS